ncbi:CDGSH iron-sulfur domain-containing protein [Streptosporangium sp. NPDC050855]|uniref:CDGSH iron-sulfur domain-containing protein n=1 Tax=Streptosporangium sp. NPDC050855 TaxID=3366194 RepID=UPI0037A506BA
MTGSPVDAASTARSARQAAITELRALLGRARLLDRDLTRLMTVEEGAEPLDDSVVRPLSEALARLTVEDDGHEPGTPAGEDDGRAAEPEPGTPGERLWRLAVDATRLRTLPGLPTGVQEATAALQHLAWLFTDDAGTRAARVAELREIQAALTPQIQVAADGPYLVTNPSRITDWLGEPITVLPQMALCRCGASAMKPLCDGSHARTGFSGDKDPRRVPGHREGHEGVQITVLDDRGLCAHSGFCTDRLPTVFRQGREPFVAPSGGRMDEIVRAVRTCPSGALGYAIDGQEPAPQRRETVVEISRDGPYRITGGIPLTGDDGRPEPRDAGASTEHYSLCRCGRSRNKPFCSGMHHDVGFTDPPLSENPTLYEWAGGLPALTRMTQIFYGTYVPQDPLLAPLFSRMSPDHPERVAAWLCETFGGPRLYTERYGGYEHMIAEHAGKALTEEWRARWARLIVRAADDAGLPSDPEFRAAFVSYVEWGSRIAVENSQPGAAPPPHMPVPRWWWVCSATPGSRVSALAPVAEEPAAGLPGPGEPLGFAAHIRPLFRETDRRSMSSAFDLWSHTDVARHAEAILVRLRRGDMPCDAPWPADRVDVFARWVAEGTPG